MKKKINKIVFPLVSLLVFLSLFFIMNSVLAAADKSYGMNSTVSSGGLAGAFNVRAVGNDAGQFLSSKLGSMVGSILSFVGVLLLILVIYAGFLWMTAAGNEKSTEKAKSILVSAIIGLIIILSAYAITAFIGRQLVDTGALPAPDVTTTTDTTADLGNEDVGSEANGCCLDGTTPNDASCDGGYNYYNTDMARQVCNQDCQCVLDCAHHFSGGCGNDSECDLGISGAPAMVCNLSKCLCEPAH